MRLLPRRQLRVFGFVGQFVVTSTSRALSLSSSDLMGWMGAIASGPWSRGAEYLNCEGLSALVVLFRGTFILHVDGESMPSDRVAARETQPMCNSARLSNFTVDLQILCLEFAGSGCAGPARNAVQRFHMRLPAG